MKKSTKGWLLTAIILILLGGAIFTVIMSLLNWDFMRLSTVKYETNKYEITENFENVSIISNTADIEILPCADDKSTILCYEGKDEKHSVLVKDNTLLIEYQSKKEWYQYIGVNFNTSKITVYLPKTEFENFLIKTRTSDIEIKDISLGGLDIYVTTGDVFLTNINCENVVLKGNTGDATLRDVIAKEKFSIERSTGDVEIENSDANEIFIKTSTGDVEGSLLSEKVFIAKSNTGDVEVPKTTKGGKCEVVTNTGDIEIDIK